MGDARSSHSQNGYRSLCHAVQHSTNSQITSGRGWAIHRCTVSQANARLTDCAVDCASLPTLRGMIEGGGRKPRHGSEVDSQKCSQQQPGRGAAASISTGVEFIGLHPQQPLLHQAPTTWRAPPRSSFSVRAASAPRHRAAVEGGSREIEELLSISIT